VTRFIGVDHGSRRIGVAVGDTETGMAFARAALPNRAASSAADAIRRLVEQEGAALVVLGLPYEGDGSEGAQAGRVRIFGEQLERIGLEVVYEDERLSSWAAAEQLSDAGRRPSRSSGEVDSAAARVILQQYLDRRRSPARPEETT